MGRSSGKAKKGPGRTVEELDLASEMFRDVDTKKSTEIKDGNIKKSAEIEYAICGCCPAGLVLYPQSVGDVLSTNCHQAFKENFEMFLRKQKDKNKNTSRYFKLKHEQRMGFACLMARFCKGASEESKKKGTHLFSTIDKWADDLLDGFDGAETLLAHLKDIANDVPRAPAQQVIQKVVINQPGTRPGEPGSQIIVPLQTLQNLKPGEGIPTGQPGDLLIKTETGQYQIVRVGPPGNQPSTNTTGQPPTTTTVQPSISTTVHPSKGHTVQPSTSTTVHPSTSTTVHPSSSTTAQPSTGTAVHPSTSTAVQPSTGTAVQPSTGPTVQPHTSTTVQPPTSTRVQPSTSTTVQPHTSTTVQPLTSTSVQPSSSTSVQPSTGPTVQPHTGPTVQPHTSTIVQPSTSTTVQPHTSTTVQPPTSTTVQPSTSTTVGSPGIQPPTNTTVQPSTSTTVGSPGIQPPTNITVQPPTSTTVQPATGITVLPPTSTTVQPSSNTTIQSPTSTTVQAPTRTTVQHSVAAQLPRPSISTPVPFPNWPAVVTSAPVSSASAPPLTSTATANAASCTRQTMTPDERKVKCKKFLETLLRRTSDQPELVVRSVRLLIQGLIDGMVEPEMFTTKLQKVLKAEPKPRLVSFLKKCLPYLQHSLATRDLSIEGIVPPIINQVGKFSSAVSAPPAMSMPTMPAVLTSAPVSRAPAPPLVSTAVTSAASTSQKMTPDEAKVKCKRFLATLLRLASDQPELVARNVRVLIQGLIDGRMEPEVFTTKLQKELNSSPQPCLVPFLKISLPYLQHSLATRELSIEGVIPPTINQVGILPSAVSAPPVKGPASLPRAPLDISIISEESYKDVKGLVISAHKWVVEQLDVVLEEFKQFRDGLEEKERKSYDNLVQEQNKEWRDLDTGNWSKASLYENIKEIQKEMDDIIARHNNQNKDIDMLVELIEGKKLGAIPKKKKEKLSKSKKNQEKESKDADNNENIDKKDISTLKSAEKLEQFKSEMSIISIKNVKSDEEKTSLSNKAKSKKKRNQEKECKNANSNENKSERDISTLQSYEKIEQFKSETSIMSIKNVNSDEEKTSLSNKAKKKKNQEKEFKDANNNEYIGKKVISTLQSDKKLEQLKSETSIISIKNVKSDEEKTSLSNKAKKNQENNENIDEKDINTLQSDEKLEQFKYEVSITSIRNVKSDEDKSSLSDKAKMADELKKAMAALNITKAKLEQTENQLRAERSKNAHETVELKKAMEALNPTKAKLEKTETRLRADRSKNADELKKAVEALNTTKAKLEETENRLRAERSKNANENYLLRSKLLFNDFKKHRDVLRQRQKNNFSVIDHLRASPEWVQIPEVQTALRSLHAFSAQLLLADQELSHQYTTLCRQLQTTYTIPGQYTTWCQQIQTSNTIPELSFDLSGAEPPDLGSSCMNLLYQSILMSQTSPTFPSPLTSSPLGYSLPASHTRDGTPASRVTLPPFRSQGIGLQLPTESIGSVISNGATATSFRSTTATAKNVKPRADQKKDCGPSKLVSKSTNGCLKRGEGDVSVSPEDTSCSICFEAMDESNSFYLKLCQHRFHTACLKQWLQSSRGVSSTCPMCRTYIPKENQFSSLKAKKRF